MACLKSIVRGVDTFLSSVEALDLFTVAGAISVYQCNCLAEGVRLPTKSVAVTFVGPTLPSEINVGLYCIE